MFLRFQTLHILFAGFCGYGLSEIWGWKRGAWNRKRKTLFTILGHLRICWQRALSQSDKLGRSDWGWHQGTLDLRNHLRPILALLISQEYVLHCRPLSRTQEMMSLFMSLWLKYERVNMLQRYFLIFLPTHPSSSFDFIYLMLAALALHCCT